MNTFPWSNEFSTCFSKILNAWYLLMSFYYKISNYSPYYFHLSLRLHHCWIDQGKKSKFRTDYFRYFPKFSHESINHPYPQNELFLVIIEGSIAGDMYLVERTGTISQKYSQFGSGLIKCNAMKTVKRMDLELELLKCLGFYNQEF